MAENLEELPLLVPFPQAVRVMGLGLTKAYAMRQAGEFPLPVRKYGSKYLVPRADLIAYASVSETPLSATLSSLVVGGTQDTPKMLRETFCRLQSMDIPAKDRARLQRLVDRLDLLRPLGPDGKHGEDRHTPFCGCVDK